MTTTVKILSATYGPTTDDDSTTHLAGFRFMDHSYDHTAKVLVESRDVLPFILILLNIAAEKIAPTTNSETLQSSSMNYSWDDVKIPRNVNNLILLEAGQSMNNIFGDPAPGTTKKLSLEYFFLDETMRETSSSIQGEILSSSFFEHESIVVKRFPSSGYGNRVTTLSCSEKEQDNISPWIEEEVSSRKMNVNNSFFVVPDLSDVMKQFPSSSYREDVSQEIDTNDIMDMHKRISQHQSSPSSAKRARSISTSSSYKMCSPIWEWLLPIILPFLELHQRVDSQCVCKTWRSVIQEWGYLQVLDVSNSSVSITPSFISGIMAQSYASLHSLFLTRVHDLSESILIPALPQLRKLTTLDISYCVQLGDVILDEISQHSRSTLEVLYMKGLNRVTDRGISYIAQGCTYLRILDISFLRITDVCAILIGNHLTRLEALYLRDNYMLTNQSIDIISRNCTKLKQLTLWGCIKLSHFLRDSRSLSMESFCCEHLLLLNLWGVHALTDGISSTIKTLVSLRTLIVSECHKLSDAFVVDVATSVIGPRIQHFHLRFLRKLTDTSVMAIAHNMTSLYSLDLSFCTLLTLDAIALLIERTSKFLCELRLYNCSQIDLSLPVTEPNTASITDTNLPNMSIAGTRLLDAIQLNGNSGTLYMLDVRGCAGTYLNHDHRDRAFSWKMSSLGYRQWTPGFFQRATQWTDFMKQKHYEYLIDRI